jgi:hypothetical protein
MKQQFKFKFEGNVTKHKLSCKMPSYIGMTRSADVRKQDFMDFMQSHTAVTCSVDLALIAG